ncbi:hypothetical protein [Microbacterium sp.]|uniref:hypothetical protein n=1 Tax=Microbacterium sp. TaxID=51671 RepID=UPI0039E39F43
MLRPVEPTDPRAPAYRVPWQVCRDDLAHPVVSNRSGEPADFVRIFHDDPADRASTQLWGQVLPGERMEVCLCSADLDEVVVTIAWFRPHDGLEYVWRFVV